MKPEPVINGKVHKNTPSPETLDILLICLRTRNEIQDYHRKESFCCELLTRILFFFTYKIYFSLILETR